MLLLLEGKVSRLTEPLSRPDTVSATAFIGICLRGDEIFQSGPKMWTDRFAALLWLQLLFPSPLYRAPFGAGASRSSCLSSPVSGGGGSGCSQVGNKIADPASPGSPGPSSSRPSTPLVNSANSVSPASSPQTAAAQLKNCLRSTQHTVNQARTSVQLGKQEMHTDEIYPKG